MRSKITVTVSAQSGVGKTTVADLLTRFLLEQGFEVEQEEFEPLAASFYSPESCQRRKESVAEHSKIIVQEVSARCDPKPTDDDSGGQFVLASLKK